MLNQQLLEVEVIGSILLEPKVFEDIIAIITEPQTFRDSRNQALYEMFMHLSNKKELITIANIAATFGNRLNETGGITYMMDAVSSIASPWSAVRHAEKLVQMNTRRKLSALLEQTKRVVDDPSAEDNIEIILNDFEQKSLDIRPKKMDKDDSIKDLMAWFQKLEEKVEDKSKAYGLLTGLTEIDRLTLGFQRGDLIVEGARTSIGKSAFATQCALNINARGNKCAIFSMEMSKAQIYNRMAANLEGVYMQNLRTGEIAQEKLASLTRHMDAMQKIHIDETRGITAEYIASEMRRLKRTQGLDFVVVDYLQEIIEDNEKQDNSGSALHRICQKLRKAAQECDCVVMGLSQVKQEVDVRQNKRPFISDLSGSAAIGAVADVIMLLYRDEYYDPNTTDKNIMEVNVAKQRNGPTGLTKFYYDKNYQRITNLAR